MHLGCAPVTGVKVKFVEGSVGFPGVEVEFVEGSVGFPGVKVEFFEGSVVKVEFVE